MKKSILLGLGAIAMAAGVTAACLQSLNAIEAKADVEIAKRVYLGGGTDGTWDVGDAYDSKRFKYLGEADGKHIFKFTGTITQGFKVMVTWDNNKDHARYECWWNSTSGSARANFTGGNANEGTDTNIYPTASGSGKTYTIYFRTDFNNDYYIHEILEGSVDDKEVYFINGWSWAAPQVNAFNSEGSLLGSDVAMTQIDKIKFRVAVYAENDYDTTWYDAISIWKASVPGNATQVWFSKSDGSQKTGKNSLTNKGVYSFKVNGKYFGVASLLINTVDSMQAASYKGKEYSESICGIANPSSIVAAYNAEIAKNDSDITDSVKHSKIVTNDVANYGSNEDVAMEKIADVLANKPSGANTIISGVESKNNIALIAGIAALGLAAAGMMVFVAKRRKEN